MKKKFLALSLALLTGVFLVACGGNKEGQGSISLVSREEGSGTRAAFVELTGVEEKNDQGEKKDMTSEEAIIQTKTDAVISTVKGDKAAIGYISVGSLNDQVKALKIDSASTSKEDILAGNYSLVRPFNIALASELSEISQDFIDFILSKEGQEIVGEDYIAVVDNPKSYQPKDLEGKIVIAGSSSVTPVMEKLKEAYMKINKSAELEIQMSDSSSGLSYTMDGLADIAMVSRDLKEGEDLEAIKIALDGIAVIVNKENSLDNMSKEDLRKIFTGQIGTWEDVKGE